MKKKYLFGGLASLFVFISVGFAAYLIRTEGALGLNYDPLTYQYLVSDVIGSRDRTNGGVTGVNFNVTGAAGNTVTSTYVNKIGGVKTEAVYTIFALTASSTSNARFEIQGSNDFGCDTTATSTTDAAYTADSYPNSMLTSDIFWSSAGDHLKNKVHATSFTNSSSTADFLWLNPSAGQQTGQEVILTDLDYECLRLAVSASSTQLYAQLRSK